MKRMIALLLALVALAWTGICWLLFKLAGAGGVVVVRVTNWFELDPSSTQWLADGLDTAGSIAQGLVGLIWFLGVALVVAIAWLIRKSRAVAFVVGRSPSAGQPGDIIEGEIGSRQFSQKRSNEAKRG